MGTNSRSFALSAGVLVPALLFLIFVLVAVTVFRTEIPILLDYPNHLARFWLLLGGARQAPLAPFYAVDWGRSTLVGMDALALAFGQFVPYTIAGKAIAFLALAGPPAGAAGLSRAAFGRWHWWQLSFPLLTFSTTALFGLLAFQISVALALAFACLDSNLPAERGVKFVLRILFGSFVLFFHPFGLGFYLMTLFAIIIGPDWRSLAERSRQIQIIRSAVVAVPTLVVPVLCLLLLAHTSPGWHTKTDKLFYWGISWSTEIKRALSPFVAYQLGVDLLFLAAPLAIVGYAFLTKRIRTHAGLAIVGLGLGVLSVISPTGVGDEPTFGMRFPIMAALLLFAAVLPEPFAARSIRIAVAATVFVISAARIAYVDQIWQARQSDVRSFESAISHIPPGAKVFALQAQPADPHNSPTGRYLVFDSGRHATVFRHLPTLVIPQRQAFVPSLFAIPGEQPVRFLPPWDAMTIDSYEVPDVHVIEKKALPPEDLRPAPDLFDVKKYLRDWQKTFDYVVMIEMDHESFDGPFDPPAPLQLVSDHGSARLYRIVK